MNRAAPRILSGVRAAFSGKRVLVPCPWSQHRCIHESGSTSALLNASHGVSAVGPLPTASSWFPSLGLRPHLSGYCRLSCAPGDQALAFSIPVPSVWPCLEGPLGKHQWRGSAVAPPRLCWLPGSPHAVVGALSSSTSVQGLSDPRREPSGTVAQR